MKTSIKTVLILALSGTAATAFSAETQFSPAAFVEQVAQEGMLEMALGELALKKSETPAVQEFARQLIDHHGKVGAELNAIAKLKGIEPPLELDSTNAARVMALDTEEGASFDHVYARHINADQERAIELFENAAKCSDAEVAQFAQSALPTLKANHAMAKKLARQAR